MTNSPSTIAVMRRTQLNKITYLGGHPEIDGTIKGTVLVIDDRGIHLRQIRERFVIPWASVDKLEVEGPEVAAKRVTVTRLVALGVFAFAAKKTGDAESFVHIEAEGHVIGFQVPKPASEVRSALGPWSTLLRSA